jgi:predicted type IV restriction endonuclease
MKRLSFKSVKASISGRMKEVAAKEQQEYQNAFEQERACSLQLEKEIADLNQATITRDRTKESKDGIDRLRKALDQIYEEVWVCDYYRMTLSILTRHGIVGV